MIGTRLGRYEVLEKLGEGGMGEVYKARDARLDRSVAIKVLPAHLAGDAEFRERFDREARAISQLSDPHICAIYDVGEAPSPEPRSDRQSAEGAATSSHQLSAMTRFAFSNESGQYQVYVQPFPGPGGKWQVSNGGGASPRWRRDGRELFYLAPDGAVMAAPVRVSADGQAVESGEPARLFRAPIVLGGSTADNVKQQYDVTADGQRFLINVTAEEANVAPITVVLNWTSVLKK